MACDPHLSSGAESDVLTRTPQGSVDGSCDVITADKRGLYCVTAPGSGLASPDA